MSKFLIFRVQSNKAMRRLFLIGSLSVILILINTGNIFSQVLVELGEAGCKAEFPSAPVYGYIPAQENGEDSLTFEGVHYYASADSSSGIWYELRYFDLIPGIHFTNDEDFFLIYRYAFDAQFRSVPFEANNVQYNSSSGKEYSYRPEKKSLVTVQHYLRGSRNYVLVVQYHPDFIDSEQVRNFFDSFEFLPFLETNHDAVALSNFNVELNLPDTPEILIDTFTNTFYSQLDYKGYGYSYDSLSGVSYNISCDVYPTYFTIEDEDIFLDQIVYAYAELADSIISSENVTIQGCNGKLFLLGSEDNNALLKSLVLMSGNVLFHLYCYVAPCDTSDKSVAAVFSSLRVQKPDKVFDNKSSKAGEIFKNIGSPLPDEQLAAVKALEYYPFAEVDLPGLYDSFFSKIYPGYIDSTEIRNSLIEVLFDVRDNETFSFLKRVYSIYTTDIKKQLLVLSILSEEQTKESVSIFAELLSQYVPKPYAYDDLYPVFNPLFDSLQLVSEQYVKLLPLLNKVYFDTYIAELTVEMYLSGILTEADLNKHKDDYLKAFNNITNGIDELKENESGYENAVATLTYLCRIIGIAGYPDEINEKLVAMTMHDDPGVAMEASLSLIKHGQSVSEKVWKKIAENNFFRYELMKRLSESGNRNLIPEKLNNQSTLALADLIRIIVWFEEFGLPEFVEVKTTRYNLDEVNVYVYKVQNSDGNTYIGLSGPYPSDLNKFSFTSEFTDVYYEEYSVENVTSLIRELTSITPGKE